MGDQFCCRRKGQEEEAKSRMIWSVFCHLRKWSQGRNGRAFLFSHTMNIVVGPKEDRQLMTGLHTVADIYCCDCHEALGWKYERAYEETQKYKEGKFILEKSKIVKENW
ncbi:Protein yippee-like [Cocos nucifera]|uniref:Protein yippee-like n=1 Tax=Cocos nucifera TaxID=13894 RepID=A0A8K0N5B7_COCNU|nr:Protein yippee-like [Cocos nucifera]